MNTTLVTCYYKIKSKRPHSDYLKYIDNLLGNLNDSINMVIYTSSDLVNIFTKYVKNKSRIIIITKEFEDIPLYKKYIGIWDSQYTKDNQKNTGRTYKCYVLWNSKINFVTETIGLNPFNSSYFIWIDIGCVRDNQYKRLVSNFPNESKISKNSIDIVLLKDFQNKNQKFFKDEIHFSGAIYGGSKSTFLRFEELYYKKFDKYLENNQFIGCDQQIISSVYLENNELFNIVLNTNSTYNSWFFIIKYYSN